MRPVAHPRTFGDGATDEGPTALYAYAGAGTYAVTLKVTDADGTSASASLDAEVGPPSGRVEDSRGGVDAVAAGGAMTPS